MNNKTDFSSIIGMVLIGVILVWMMYSGGADAPVETQTNTTEQVQEEEAMGSPAAVVEEAIADSIIPSNGLQARVFSLPDAQEDAILENDKLKIEISAKGARMTSAVLKDYKTYGGGVLELIDPDRSDFSLLLTGEGEQVKSSDLVFELVKKSDSEAIYRLSHTNGSSLEYRYAFSDSSQFQIDFSIVPNGLKPISGNNLNWSLDAYHLEKDMKMERSKSTMFYFSENEVDNLSRMGEDNEQISNIQWIGFQQQFFTTFLRFDSNISKADIAVQTLPETEKNHTVSYNAVLELPADGVNMHWYFVPNHFGTLNKLGYDFDEVVPLGWAIFGWVNRWFVIPLFNLFDGMNLNYGIIILIMSILIKLILFPFQIKSYVSMAKIRVLKPEIDEINKKHEDQMKRQQAVMELYRQTGANPLGGCLPMLFQLPFLIALFQFFPASFELRQQSFLWADDLSSYDSIYSWTGDIPLISSFYGNHISLFTILMAASLFFYTKINQSMTPQQGGAMAAQMKIITYLMPFMMLFWFNSYASGLSYYYFLANVISFGQQWAIRRFFIDEEAIHAQLQEKKAQPKKTGNRFQRRLEEVMKEQQKKQPKK